ncbi:STAS domain-containing protein [Streptomyces sp. NPDC016469]|uniref:STAS domain-containing protein n=1 Tax=Streptomyces sp. NPDC016469 TaxID=3157191 RepID=UPI0033D57437
MEAPPPAAFVLSGHITRDAVPRLCADLESLMAASPDATTVDCDLSGVVRPDLTTVDAIARLTLIARRTGTRALRLHGTTPELRALLELVGLGEAVGDVSAPPPRSRRSPR